MRSLAYDTEVYSNYTLLCFLDCETGEIHQFERFENGVPCEGEYSKLIELLNTSLLISFNGKGYDNHIVYAFMNGNTCQFIKNLSDDIILNQMKTWQTTKKYGTYFPYQEIDIMEVLPGVITSLKLYGCRVNFPKLQELPIDPSKHLDLQEISVIKDYCVNDCQVTQYLYDKIENPIKLRSELSELYGMDLMSRSDAQIAETIITSEFEKLAKQKLQKPTPRKFYEYDPPDWIKFKTKPLQQLVLDIADSMFDINDNAQIITPNALQQVISIGDRSYQLGIGGLHSVDGPGTFYSSDTHRLVTWDVASYYPNIAILAGFEPANMKGKFTKIYKTLVDRRLAAKARGDIDESESLKIAINGTFGKLNSKYSKLYSPDLLFHITVSGQLTLLMLIETMDSCGINCVSANTDGVCFYMKHALMPIAQRIIKNWENDTGFTMDMDDHKFISRRDVNNYMTVFKGGKVKTKGALSFDENLRHNPSFPILALSVKEYLENGVPIEQTVRGCTDITKFISARTVNGGAEFRGITIGKIVRWYYSNTSTDAIHYIKRNVRKDGTIPDKGNKVPLSDNSVPILDLPKMLPGDVDFTRYIDEANSLLNSININPAIGQNIVANKLKLRGLSPVCGDHTGVTIADIGNDFSQCEQLATQTGWRAGVIAIKDLDRLTSTTPTLTNSGWHFYKFNRLCFPSVYKKMEKVEGCQIKYGGPILIDQQIDSDSEMSELPDDIISTIIEHLNKTQKEKINNDSAIVQ